MTDTLDVRLANDLSEIPRLAERVEEFLGEHDLPPKFAFEINLALDELLTNVISYGLPAETRHEIAVVLTLSDDGLLTAELADPGVPFDPFAEAKPPVLEGAVEDRPIGGLGVHFVKTLMDEVHYARDGGVNRIRLSKRTR